MAAVLGGAPGGWVLPGDDPRVARLAREQVTEVLADLPVELVNDARVVASELVTNAALYTRSHDKGGVIGLAVTVAPTGTAVDITVIDQGALPGHVPTVLPSGRVGGGGLGLSVCGALGNLSVAPVGASPADGHVVRVHMDVAEVPR
jgi:Histidine kinase-like ATPase domain